MQKITNGVNGIDPFDLCAIACINPGLPGYSTVSDVGGGAPMSMRPSQRVMAANGSPDPAGYCFKISGEHPIKVGDGWETQVLGEKLRNRLCGEIAPVG